MKKCNSTLLTLLAVSALAALPAYSYTAPTAPTYQTITAPTTSPSLTEAYILDPSIAIIPGLKKSCTKAVATWTAGSAGPPPTMSKCKVVFTYVEKNPDGTVKSTSTSTDEKSPMTKNDCNKWALDNCDGDVTTAP